MLDPIFLPASLAFGVQNTYKILGSHVTFENTGTNPIYRLAIGILFGRYFDVLFHELGHSLAYRFACGEYGTITIASNGNGDCSAPTPPIPSIAELPLIWWRLSKIPPTSVLFAGHLAQALSGIAKSYMAYLAIKASEKFSKYKYINTMRRVCAFIIKFQTKFAIFLSITEISYLIRSINGIRWKSYMDTDWIDMYRHYGALSVSLGILTILALDSIALSISRKITVTDSPPGRYQRCLTYVKRAFSAG